MSDIATRPPYVRWAAVFVWLATLFNAVIAIAAGDVGRVQLGMLLCLAFASGLYAGWIVDRPRSRR